MSQGTKISPGAITGKGGRVALALPPGSKALGLGPAYTENVEGAWVAAYTVLADTMKTAAKAPLSA